MFVRIPPKYSVSEIMGYLKGKSSLMIFERHADLKYKYGNRHFWCRGYYVDTVGKNAKKIEEYIRNQLQEDWEYDQMSLKEYLYNSKKQSPIPTILLSHRNDAHKRDITFLFQKNFNDNNWFGSEISSKKLLLIVQPLKHSIVLMLLNYLK